MTLPRSAIAVLTILANRGPLTHKDLVAQATIPARTVRFALRRLRDEGRVVERWSLRDSRQSYYSLATGDRATEAIFGPYPPRAETPALPSLATEVPPFANA